MVLNGLLKIFILWLPKMRLSSSERFFVVFFTCREDLADITHVYQNGASNCVWFIRGKHFAKIPIFNVSYGKNENDVKLNRNENATKLPQKREL